MKQDEPKELWTEADGVEMRKMFPAHTMVFYNKVQNPRRGAGEGQVAEGVRGWPGPPGTRRGYILATILRDHVNLKSVLKTVNMG